MRRALKPRVTTVRDGLRMYLDPLEWTQIGLLSDGTSEEPTLKLYERLLQPGDCYVDVGAHVGFHVLVARRLVGPGGRLIAVDPQPYNCDRLLRNAEINAFDNVRVVVAAVGSQDTLVTLSNQAAHDKSKLSLAANWAQPATRQSFTVAEVRLDTVSADLSRIKLLKVDVESYEWELLGAAGETLAKTDNIIIELHPESPNVAASAARLQEAGFDLMDVFGAPWSPGMPAEGHNVWGCRRSAA